MYILRKETLKQIIRSLAPVTRTHLHNHLYDVNILDILTIVFRIILGMIYSGVEIFPELNFKRGSLLKKIGK